MSLLLIHERLRNTKGSRRIKEESRKAEAWAKKRSARSANEREGRKGSMCGKRREGQKHKDIFSS